jgi:hypothetical protein
MRIVAVEEHFTFPDLLGRIDLATLDRVLEHSGIRALMSSLVSRDTTVSPWCSPIAAVGARTHGGSNTRE